MDKYKNELGLNVIILEEYEKIKLVDLQMATLVFRFNKDNELIAIKSRYIIKQ